MFLLIAALTPQPVNLDAISIDRANLLHGQPVVASFIVGNPLYTLRDKTIIGTGDKPDGIERTAVLLGKRFEFKEGRRTTVVGTMRVIHHPTIAVNMVIVPAMGGNQS
jgi:hypothetical protein